MRVVQAAIVGLLASGAAAGCGDSRPAAELVAASTTAIQGGIADTTHDFAVAVGQQGALCSGVLLAPNLVATARHCVSAPLTPLIDCASSAFGPLMPASAFGVFVGDVISAQGGSVIGVSKIIVPSGANQNLVCGNDLALLILDQSISLPQYVTPVINPPMTDHAAYTTTMTAIGYGIDDPADKAGMSAGVRRIKEDINLYCISNDATFVDCLADPANAQYISANEFEAGDGACEGDSGSGAFEQRSFNAGRWVAFGVLSRGSIDPDADTCTTPIYTRFDMWSSLLIDAAQQAASLGGYGLPLWAGGDGGPAGSTSGGSASAADASAISCAAAGTSCASGPACCSNNCLSHDNGATFLCEGCNADNPCDTGLICDQGTCVASVVGTAGSSGLAVTSGSAHASASGCAVAGPRRSGAPAWPAAAALGVGALMMARRGRRSGRAALAGSHRAGGRSRRAGRRTHVALE